MSNPEPLKYKDANEAARIYFLPNFFTAGNLFFGFLAIIRCIQAKYATSETVTHDYYLQAVACILFACICDLLDGRVARLGGRESLFGKEFDSIADTVSFGVAPALMVFFLILSPTDNYPFFRQVGWLIGFVFLLCAGVRLARFNVLTSPFLPKDPAADPGKNFKGLPAPMAAGMIASTVLVLLQIGDLHAWAIVLPPLMLLIAILMVSNIPYPSFKQVDWNTQVRPRPLVLSFIALAGALYLAWQYVFALFFLAYIFYGLIRAIRTAWRLRRAPKGSPSDDSAPDTF